MRRLGADLSASIGKMAELVSWLAVVWLLCGCSHTHAWLSCVSVAAFASPHALCLCLCVYICAAHAAATHASSACSCLPRPQALFSKYEWIPWRQPHSMASKDVLAAQHACRKLQDVSAGACWCRRPGCRCLSLPLLPLLLPVLPPRPFDMQS